jgi:mannan endo-1,4-beta-mannosidase
MRTRNTRHRRLAPVLVACLAVCAFAFWGCGTTAHKQQDFVARSGQRLLLDGHPWRFIGFNDYELSSLPGRTHCGRAVDDETVNSVMQDAEDSGASVIRTWFFQSYYDMSNTSGRWRRIRPAWTAFDRVLAAAAAHHLLVIPVLVNEWPNCEPSTSAKGIAFFHTGYTHPAYGYPLSFKQYAATVARHYADDSTIAFWQLGNELQSDSPSGCEEHASADALRAFADQMTTVIKSVDPHHLVSLGTVGADQCGLAGGDYQYVYAGRIDVCEYHDYGVATSSIPNGANSLAERIQQCRALDKPLFIGESGIPADTNDFGQSTGRITNTSLQLRAGFFDAKITAAFNAGIVGYVIWDKRQDASNSAINYGSGRYMVGPDDPTNRVTAALSRTFGVTPGTVRFSFENGGIDGWRAQGSPQRALLENSSEEAWGGDRSLKVVLREGTRSVFAGTSAISGARSGTTITFHVYVSSIAQRIDAAPFIVDRPSDRVEAHLTKLLPGWNVVQWTIPRRLPTPLRELGLAIDNPLGFSGPLFLDNVSW